MFLIDFSMMCSAEPNSPWWATYKLETNSRPACVVNWDVAEVIRLSHRFVLLWNLRKYDHLFTRIWLSSDDDDAVWTFRWREATCGTHKSFQWRVVAQLFRLSKEYESMFTLASSTQIKWGRIIQKFRKWKRTFWVHRIWVIDNARSSEQVHF